MRSEFINGAGMPQTNNNIRNHLPYSNEPVQKPQPPITAAGPSNGTPGWSKVFEMRGIENNSQGLEPNQEFYQSSHSVMPGMTQSLFATSEAEGWPARSTIPWNVTPANGFGAAAGPDVNGAVGQIPPTSDKSSSRNSRSSDSPSVYYPSSLAGAIGTTSNNSPPRTTINHADEGAFHSLAGADQFARLNGFETESQNQQFNMGAFTNNNHLTTDLQGNSLPMVDASLGVPGTSALSFDIPSTHRTHTASAASMAKPNRQSSLSNNLSLGSIPTPFPSAQSSRQPQAVNLPVSQNRQSMTQFELASHIAKLEADDGSRMAPYNFASPRPRFQPRVSFDPSQPRLKPNVARDDTSTFGTFAPQRLQMDVPLSNVSPRDFASPPPNEPNYGIASPFYSGYDTQSSTGQGLSSPAYRLPNQASEDQAEALERRLRGLQLQQQEYAQSTLNNMLQPAYRMVNHPNSGMSHLAGAMFAANPLGNVSNGVPPRTPGNEQDCVQVIRSPLLQEFRSNSKGNKRYELKDIYGHIVEFCGDQHGSRFIQQKLEGANSDEKERVFQEIMPDSLQLMMDLFGNYVIQKLFEHGNQAQKKALAQQMMNHILALSLQMYGCRVVQKALEHVLTDQQVAMVRELEHYVHKCVCDQNGNHVIQKAIERVPMEHIQFIINAFKGHIGRYAAHSYGCRVIQRLLEHCNDLDRRSILSELSTIINPLVTDQFGNYVIQHMIARGPNADRNRVIAVVQARLVELSKHKFASNVVEKSIQYGSDRQRSDMIQFLITRNHNGESPLSILIRDQYANYVVQKLLTVNGPEHQSLVNETTYIIQEMNRQQSAKQIAAIEKVLKLNPVNRADLSPLFAPLGNFDPTTGLDMGSNSVPSINASVLNSPTGLSASASSASQT